MSEIYLVARNLFGWWCNRLLIFYVDLGNRSFAYVNLPVSEIEYRRQQESFIIEREEEYEKYRRIVCSNEWPRVTINHFYQLFIFFVLKIRSVRAQMRILTRERAQ